MRQSHALRGRYGRSSGKSRVRLKSIPSARHKGLAVVLVDGDQILYTLVDGASSMAAGNAIDGLPREWAKGAAEVMARRADEATDPRVIRHAAAMLWPLDRARAQSYVDRADRIDPQRTAVVLPVTPEEDTRRVAHRERRR
jgi:hypothetical protein